MSKMSTKTLTYEIPANAEQEPCFICGHANTIRDELCSRCHAPMALTRQSADEKTPPQLIAIIGTAGAGKTVYLGLLTDMLSRPGSELQMLSRGAFSVSLQQDVITALSQCRFPEKTPNEPDRWNWLHSEVKRKNGKLRADLVVPDMAGEAILEEIEHRGTYPVIQAYLAKCTAVMLLIDGAELAQGDQQQDFFAVKIISHLSEMKTGHRRGWRDRPVAVVFTKADSVGHAAKDAEAFAKRHSPGLWQHTQEKLKSCQFFAASVAGACAERQTHMGPVQVPLRIEPRGIVEPFSWLVDQLPKRSKSH